MNTVVVGFVWYCAIMNPLCGPAHDPTGPPVSYTFPTVLACEYRAAMSLMIGAIPDGMVFRHTCSKHEMEYDKIPGEEM